MGPVRRGSAPADKKGNRLHAGCHFLCMELTWCDSFMRDSCAFAALDFPGALSRVPGRRRVSKREAHANEPTA